MTKPQSTLDDVASIVRELAPLRKWVKYTSPEGPQPQSETRSALMGDDKATNPYQISHAAWRGITMAVDHLNTLNSMIVGAKVLHIFSPFTILRAAMENAATAVWLLAPRKREDRLVRRLQLAALDMANMDKLVSLAGATARRTLQQRQEDLKKIAAGRGIAESQFLKSRPGYEEIVGKAGAETPMGERVAKVVWKACSAVAHGDMSTVIALLQYSTLGQQRNIVSGSAEAPVETLALMTALTVAMTEKAIALYESRRTSPY